MYDSGTPVVAIVSALALSSSGEELAVYAYEIGDYPDFGGKHGFIWTVSTADGNNLTNVIHIEHTNSNTLTDRYFHVSDEGLLFDQNS